MFKDKFDNLLSFVIYCLLYYKFTYHNGKGLQYLPDHLTLELLSKTTT